VGRRRFGRWVPVASVVAAGLVVALAPPAGAAGESITLEPSRTLLTYGQNTDLSGVTEPVTPGQEIHIVDAADGTVLAAATTNSAGAYTTKLDQVPSENVTVQALWVATGALSDPVPLKVRPVLTAKLSRPRLFDKVKVRGSIQPPQREDRVTVTLFRGGQAVGKKKVDLKDGNTTYKATFRIPKTGTYRGRAKFDDDEHATAIDWTGKRTAPLPPNISMGSTGIYTRLLEKRLRQLHYWVPPPNKKFDHRTADGVIAFHKVQFMPRVDYVTGKTWKRLQKPIRPSPRAKKRPFHIEVDQTRQVLFVIKHRKIAWIVHTSTGAGGATHDGVFYVHRKIAGYSPNLLYYPSYFDGNRAVHGWPKVPTYPASHGCARVPNWTAIWLYHLMDMGTQVRVYHS
jgi:N-acetylmuramoyl-L-alanine amidase